jgi:glycosyltransferase involved in cell wall biosynthesis
MKKGRAVAFVSAFNEEKTVRETVISLKKTGFHVVVVDDGSKDRTLNEAIKGGAEVIKLDKNRGKGKALKEAVFRYNLQEFDFIAFADADLGESAQEMEKLLKVVEKGKADLAVAHFPPPEKKGGFGLVKGLARFAISRKGFNSQSPLSGQRVLRKEMLGKLKFDDGFGFEVGMTLDILTSGGRIQEVPVVMSHRETGRSIGDFFHRGKQLIDVLKAVFRRELGL